MKKITTEKLVLLVTEALMQEYYRDFESKVKKLGFDSVVDAARKMVLVPEYVEWFGGHTANFSNGGSS